MEEHCTDPSPPSPASPAGEPASAVAGQEEQVLPGREGLYRVLAESAQDAIFIILRDGRIGYVNSEGARMFGCQPQDLVGKLPEEVYAPGTFERQRRNLQAIFDTGLPASFENPSVIRGREIWQETSLTPLKDEGGQVRAVMGIARDVTARKQIEEALRQSEERYRAISEIVSDFAYSVQVEPDGALVAEWVTEAHTRVTGYTPAEAIARNDWQMLVHPDDLPIAQRHLQAVLSGQADVGEYRIVTKDGQVRWLRDYARPAWSEAESRVVRILAAGQDITARKQAEEALRVSELQYRSTIDSMKDPIHVVDPDLRLVLCNHALRQWIEELKLGPDPIGRSVFELFPFLPERVRDEYRAAFETGETMITEETTWVGEREFITETRKIPIFEGGKVVQVVTVIHDITDRKQLQAQVLQAQKMEIMGRLAGGVAHDFNNFLTAIRGYASLARSALRPGDPVRDDIEQVLRAAERAAALTSQLLAFSRRQIIEPRVLDLNGLVMDMDKMVRRLVGEDIELVVLPAPDLGLVRMDPSQIEQVLVNLVLNARDAMPEGGTLTIQTGNGVLDEERAREHPGISPGPFVELAVRDTGVGMTEEVKAHLFEPFFTTKEVGRGTGLGLATVYGIIKQSQGAVVVSSEPGRGTAVQIYLPQVEGEAEPFRRGEVEHLPRGSETVLVVEDEPAVRGLIARVLGELGYDVLEAANGEEALRLVEAQGEEIHLLLTDVVMPLMDGVAIAGRLREIYPRLAVLYTSGYAGQRISQRGILENGMAFLPKPFTVSMLAYKVREALDRGET